MSSSKVFYTIQFQHDIFNHLNNMFEINLEKYPAIYPYYLEYLDYLDFQRVAQDISNGGLQNIKEIYNSIKSTFQTDIPNELQEPKFFLDTYYSWLAYSLGGIYDFNKLHNNGKISSIESTLISPKSSQNSITEISNNFNSDILDEDF